jgi:hypothetical protein
MVFSAVLLVGFFWMMISISPLLTGLGGDFYAYSGYNKNSVAAFE